MASIYRCTELTSLEVLSKILRGFTHPFFSTSQRCLLARAVLPDCSCSITAALSPSPSPFNKDKQGCLIKSKCYHFQLSVKLLIWKAPCLAFIVKECCDQCNIRPITAVMVLRDVFLFPLCIQVQRKVQQQMLIALFRTYSLPRSSSQSPFNHRATQCQAIANPSPVQPQSRSCL